MRVFGFWMFDVKNSMNRARPLPFLGDDGQHGKSGIPFPKGESPQISAPPKRRLHDPSAIPALCLITGVMGGTEGPEQKCGEPIQLKRH